MKSHISRISLICLVMAIVAAILSDTHAGEPYQLENGLTVILRPISGAKQVAVVLLFDMGAAHDPEGKSGMAHVLEHLYCTAAAGDKPSRDFMQIQKRYAAGYNQQTGSDYTVFAGIVDSEELDIELKDAAARMGDLYMTEVDLQREVPRVLQELTNMYNGIPSLAGINHARMHLHPIPKEGRHGGNADHIISITLAELRQLWDEYYKPNNAILVLAGGFEPLETKESIRQAFASIPRGKTPPEIPLGTEALTGKIYRIKVRPVMPNATGVVSKAYAAPLPGSEHYAPFLMSVSRLWVESQSGTMPPTVQPVYYPMLDDPSTIVLQASLQEGEDPDTILKQIDGRLQAALRPEIAQFEKMRTINSMAMLGTVKMEDAMWIQNLYGLAFSVGRRHQLNLNEEKLRTEIQNLTESQIIDMAASVFAPQKGVSVIVDIES